MKFSPRFILLGTLLMVLTFGLNSMVYAQMPEAETAKPDDKVDVETLIGHMDNEISGYKDQQMDVEMIIHGDRGETKSYRLLIQQMGMDKRLVRFLSGENKGMRILMDGDNKAYVYIPRLQTCSPHFELGHEPDDRRFGFHQQRYGVISVRPDLQPYVHQARRCCLVRPLRPKKRCRS